jgi:UDP-N-acetyl-D-mannosaminuronic acid transferase (WecB/TagA/CpsF family)
MISKIVFKKITFINLKEEVFKKIISKKGFFVFPSGPALSEIKNSKNYYNSLKKADFVFFDSGLFVLLLKIFKQINVNKFSGYKFLNFFFKYLKKNKKKSVFCIDPNLNFSKSNNKYLKSLGVKKVYNFIAPKYNSNNLFDKKLLKEIKRVKPNFIMTNIGGGTQEILGLYLKKNLRFKTTILCTGGAISFFTGDQAPINNLIDQLYLGWFVRLIFNPLTFFKRYIKGLKLISMVINSNVKVITDGKKITKKL